MVNKTNLFSLCHFKVEEMPNRWYIIPSVNDCHYKQFVNVWKWTDDTSCCPQHIVMILGTRLALFDHLWDEDQVLFKYNQDAIFDNPGVECFHPAVLLPGVSALTHLRMHHAIHIPLHHVFSPSSLITPSIIMLLRRRPIIYWLPTFKCSRLIVILQYWKTNICKNFPVCE